MKLRLTAGFMYRDGHNELVYDEEIEVKSVKSIKRVASNRVSKAHPYFESVKKWSWGKTHTTGEGISSIMQCFTEMNEFMPDMLREFDYAYIEVEGRFVYQ